jgi:hypothetical protein
MMRRLLVLALLAALGGPLAAAQAAPRPSLEDRLPAAAAGFTLMHFDHHDALFPRRRCPRGGNPFSGCVRDAQTVGSHPRADRPSIMVRVLALRADLTEEGLRRHLTRAIGPLGVQREGERRIFTRRTLGTSYAAALITPRTVAMAVAERHDRALSGSRRARAALRATLARDPDDPGPVRRVRPRPEPRAGQGAAERPRRAFDRCVTTPGSSLPVCPPSPEYLYLGQATADLLEGFDRDCRNRGIRIVWMCDYNHDLCPVRGRGVSPAVFIVDSDRYAGWLSCTDIETIPYWTTVSLSSSCSWVFRLERTTARPLNATAAGYFSRERQQTKSYGHGFWFDDSVYDLTPAVAWDGGVDGDDAYAFHNFGGFPAGARDARMFTACANP